MNPDTTSDFNAESPVHLTADDLVIRIFVRELRAQLVESFWCSEDHRRAEGDRRGERLMKQHLNISGCESTITVSIVGLDDDDALIAARNLPREIRRFLARYAKSHPNTRFSRERDGFKVRHRIAEQVQLFGVG